VWGSGSIAPPFLTSALNGGERSASRPCRFLLQKEPRYTLDRKLGRPQSRSERCGVDENLLPLPEIEPRLSIPYPVAVPAHGVCPYVNLNVSFYWRDVMLHQTSLCNWSHTVWSDLRPITAMPSHLLVIIKYLVCFRSSVFRGMRSYYCQLSSLNPVFHYHSYFTALVLCTCKTWDFNLTIEGVWERCAENFILIYERECKRGIKEIM
jgi:hypothetical protein